MVDRRTLLLDAALELVGTQGMRGLTHRAVDAAVDLPAGSTSNYFRTREALVLGIVERFIVREREMATGPRDQVDPTPQGVAEALGRFVDRATGPDRVVTLARYAILVETAQNPALRPGMAPVPTRSTRGPSTSSPAPVPSTRSATSASSPTTSPDWCSTSSRCPRPTSTPPRGSAP